MGIFKKKKKVWFCFFKSNTIGNHPYDQRIKNLCPLRWRALAALTENQNLVPSIHVRKLTVASDFSSRGVNASVVTSTHAHPHADTHRHVNWSTKRWDKNLRNSGRKPHSQISQRQTWEKCTSLSKKCFSKPLGGPIITTIQHVAWPGQLYRLCDSTEQPNATTKHM